MKTAVIVGAILIALLFLAALLGWLQEGLLAWAM